MEADDLNKLPNESDISSALETIQRLAQILAEPENAKAISIIQDAVKAVAVQDTLKAITVQDAVKAVAFQDAVKAITAMDAVKAVAFQDAVKAVAAQDAVKAIAFQDAVKAIAAQNADKVIAPQDEPFAKHNMFKEMLDQKEFRTLISEEVLKAVANIQESAKSASSKSGTKK